jgi:hypothetical protein
MTKCSVLIRPQPLIYLLICTVAYLLITAWNSNAICLRLLFFLVFLVSWCVIFVLFKYEIKFYRLPTRSSFFFNGPAGPAYNNSDAQAFGLLLFTIGQKLAIISLGGTIITKALQHVVVFFRGFHSRRLDIVGIIFLAKLL